MFSRIFGGQSMFSRHDPVPITQVQQKEPPRLLQSVTTTSEPIAPPCWIIEGVDRVGKGTLIEQLQDRLGFHQVIKFDKPKRLSAHNGSLREYQVTSMQNGFTLLNRAVNTSSAQIPKLIFDRFHLGECVYAPLYRGYSGDFVYDMESSFLRAFGGPSKQFFSRRVVLILLTAKNLAHLAPDDGHSFDPDKKDIEQNMFIDSFRRSTIPNKHMISVDAADGMLTPEEIAETVISTAIAGSFSR